MCSQCVHSDRLQVKMRTPHTPTKPTFPLENHSNNIKQTPRHRKVPKDHSGTAPPANPIDEDKSKLMEKLKLSYMPEDWQAHLISRVLSGYNTIFTAGTGYRKSLVFEGLAALGGKNKLVLVIGPLKALEIDRVNSACKKGLDAIAINEDTSKTAALWVKAQKTALLLYLSPEMALSDSFSKLWKDTIFRRHLTAVIVDEAHCVDEWGGDDFRPEYQKLEQLRAFTGKEVPFVACTATCQTSTFNVVWNYTWVWVPSGRH